MGVLLVAARGRRESYSRIFTLHVKTLSRPSIYTAVDPERSGGTPPCTVLGFLYPHQTPDNELSIPYIVCV